MHLRQILAALALEGKIGFLFIGVKIHFNPWKYNPREKNLFGNSWEIFFEKTMAETRAKKWVNHG